MVRFLWHSLPAGVGRISRTIGVAMTDGQYLAAVPVAAILGPVLALVAGAGLAYAQEDVTFTYSLLALAVFSAVAGLGAGLGTYTLIGFVAVDLAIGHPLEGYYSPDGLELLQAFSAAAISYLLLATLLVLVPLTGLGLREELTRLLRLNATAARLIVHTILVGGLIWAWAQATAFLIRPVWSFRDRTPSVEAIETLQQQTWVLVLVGMAAVVGRGLLEEYTVTHGPAWIEIPAVDPGRPRSGLIPWVGVPLKSAFLVLLMAGLVGSWLEAVVLFVVLLLPLTLQAVAGRVPPIGWFADRVPLIARVIAAGLAAYLIAVVVVEPQVRSTSSFVPMLISVTLSLGVAAILLPNRES